MSFTAGRGADLVGLGSICSGAASDGVAEKNTVFETGGDAALASSKGWGELASVMKDELLSCVVFEAKGDVVGRVLVESASGRGMVNDVELEVGRPSMIVMDTVLASGVCCGG